MRYWWVDQNQAFRQEQDGGYLWSPKRNAKGARNPLYETMREVSPGDVVFSFVKTYATCVQGPLSDIQIHASDAPAAEGHIVVVPKEHVPSIHALPITAQKGVWAVVSASTTPRGCG